MVGRSGQTVSAGVVTHRVWTAGHLVLNGGHFV
jgi:hypothetical protein